MAENSISGIIDVTLDRLKAIANAETIIGDPIEKGEITIIPVSKVSFGVATGGSDFSSKNTTAPMFGGGGGAGVTVMPIAFIVIKNDNVRIIPVNSEVTALGQAISMVPELIDKIKGLFEKDEFPDADPLAEENFKF